MKLINKIALLAKKYLLNLKEFLLDPNGFAAMNMEQVYLKKLKILKINYKRNNKFRHNFWIKKKAKKKRLICDF
jgi:hypothetical protein